MHQIINYYSKFIAEKSGIRFIFLLIGLILLMNIVIFPLLSEPDEEILDTRLFYTPSEAGSYITQLGEDNRRKSLIMHGSVDILYPIIYTLFFSSLITALRGGSALVSFPLLILLADIGENISIMMLITFPSKSFFFKLFSITAAISTPLKWGLVGISVWVIIFLLARKIYEK